MRFLTVFAVFAIASAHILANIYINDIDVGGLGREAAIETLEAAVPIGGTEIIISIDDEEMVYTFADFDAGYDFANAVDEAIEYGNGGRFFSNLTQKISLKFKNHNIEAKYSFDETKAAQISQEIAEKTAITPIEPKYSKNGTQFEIKEGRIGREINSEKLADDIMVLLSDKSGGVIAAEIAEISTNYTTADFAAATDLIGTFSTPFDPRFSNRATNIRVASGFLNNSTILPGQIFSTSQALRPRTVENGYVSAGQIKNGEPDAGIGGGICQISSTLYMAALYAETTMHERRNHTLMVGYMQPASDATLAEGHIDLKFENNTSYPMLIESILTHNQHIINIYGHENRPPGRLISFESVMLEAALPVDDKIVEDPLLPLGETRLLFPGMDGGKYELYKIIEENGAAERVKINSSNYRPMQRVVVVGAAEILVAPREEIE